MATFLLIRHAAHDLLGRCIAGRMPGVHLNREGQAQAERLAERLAHAPIRAIFSGPLERAQETALPLVQRLGLPLQISEAIDEIDFGEWTGRTFEELAEIPQWHLFNSFRSGTRIPNGELMLEAQARIVAELGRLREQYPEDALALISHGDVIKAAVAYYAGVPLDLFQRLEISPASVTVITISEYGPRVLCVNDTGDLRLE
jgi:probable phosphomutase (TIGR03848 family)